MKKKRENFTGLKLVVTQMHTVCAKKPLTYLSIFYKLIYKQCNNKFDNLSVYMSVCATSINGQ